MPSRKNSAGFRELGSAMDRGETCLEGNCFGAPILARKGMYSPQSASHFRVSPLGIPRLSVANPGADYLYRPGDQSRPQSLAISFNKSREPAVSRPSSVTVWNEKESVVDALSYLLRRYGRSSERFTMPPCAIGNALQCRTCSPGLLIAAFSQ